MVYPLGTVKVSSDASIRRNGFIGIGFVIRDNSGSIDRICGNFNVEYAEALAIRSSLSFFRECGFKNISAESYRWTYQIGSG